MKFKLAPEHYWLLLFAVCFIAYQQVQDTIRPNYMGTNALVKYLLGIAPNFFPAVGIPALFVVLIPALNKKNNANSWLNGNRNLLAIGVSLVGLIGWEFTQIITTKGHFDWNDVLWTLLGAAVFHVIWLSAPNRLKASNETSI